MVAPHSLQSLAGSWLGGSPKGTLEYARLDLGPNGTGTFIIQYLPQNPPVAYEVTRTELKKYKVRFETRVVAKDREYAITVRGRAIGSSLDLEIEGGGKLKWKREFFLEREAQVRTRIDVVTAMAKQYGEPKMQPPN